MIVEIASQFHDGYSENIQAFANNIRTHEGGTHVSGFRTALTRSLMNYARRGNFFKATDKPSGDDFREGCTAVISVKVPEPQFEGQTKTKLGNSEVEGIVASVWGEALKTYLEEHPRNAKAILDKAIQAFQAREAARKARDLVRRKGALSGAGLPGQARRLLAVGTVPPPRSSSSRGSRPAGPRRRGGTATCRPSCR